MIIPDCRSDIHYNEDFLNKDDKQYIASFDQCTDTMDSAIEVIKTDGFITLEDEFEGISETLATVLGKELPADVKKKLSEVIKPSNYEEEFEKYADVLKYELLQYIELERNELIISMIDGMPEDEYEKNREEALKRNEESENPKEYYDTRKFYDTEKEEN